MTRNLNEDALIDLGDEWADVRGDRVRLEGGRRAFNGDGTSAYGGITGLFTKIVAGGEQRRAWSPRPGTPPSPR
jgi:hypothetical protein